MPEINPITSKSKKDAFAKPSPSAQILSNVELLVAMCEEQERAATAAIEPVDTSVIETAVEKSVTAAVNDTVAKTVQTAVAEALSGSIEKALENSFSRFDKRFAQFDNRINQIDDQLNKLATNAQAFNVRFDSLDEKINSAPQGSASGSAATDLQLEAKFDLIGSALANVMLQAEKKFASLERTFQDQCRTVNGFHAKFSAADAPNTNTNAQPTAGETEAVPVGDDSASDWQQQKQAILDQYGDPEQRPLDQAKADAKPEKSADSTESEVEKLKSQLEAKLREAEVELSIERARLSQERADFERNQASLDRRSSELEAKLAALKSDGDDDEGSTDLMSRFKRHLGS